jgi:hypothetical protein
MHNDIEFAIFISQHDLQSIKVINYSTFTNIKNNKILIFKNSFQNKYWHLF